MEYDAFICHASEDKDDIARPLAEALSDHHVSVWYDEFSLDVGDSLTEAIDRGLASSRFAIVIVSPAFFQKQWTRREFSGLVAREMVSGNRVILPIWHRIQHNEILAKSPPLADRKAIKSTEGVERIAQQLLRRIRPSDSPLVVARDELRRFGWETPSLTDEWWLDLVEVRESLRTPVYLRPLLFPLPEEDVPPEKLRGVQLAWAALMNDWSNEAEDRLICQITAPDVVHEFVGSNPALREACHRHPGYLANYVPQLLIPEFSGEFSNAFDDLVRGPVGSLAKEREKATGILRRHALRFDDFGGHDPVEIADKWIWGIGRDYGANLLDSIDYLFWLLCEDSDWLPSKTRETLVDGIRQGEWWHRDLFSEIGSKSALGKTVFHAKPHRVRWTRAARDELTSIIASRFSKLGVTSSAQVAAQNFVEGGFVEHQEYLHHERLRARGGRRP